MNIHFPAAATVTVGLLMATACTNNKSGSESSEVSNYEVAQTIKSASRSFELNDSADIQGVYAMLGVSVQWPEVMGDYNLKPLQDSIVAALFGPDNVGKPVDSLMERFVSSDSNPWGDGMRVVPVDSVPAAAAESEWYVQLTAKLISFSENEATYRVGNSSYSGGAHPYTGYTYFTYDLAHAQVLTRDNMFVDGSEQAVLNLIKEALARDAGVDPAALADSGYFDINAIGQPYLSDGSVVFHYNPYEIAPYSAGQIDVAVYGYEIEPYLRDNVKALLDE